jgi:hypothetical protein
MPSDKIATAKPSLLFRTALFFILFAILLYLWVEPKLIYHDIDQLRYCRIYVPAMTVFSDFHSYPGKLVDYLGARLSQFFYFSWAGTLIITAVATFLCLATDKFITAMGTDKLRPLRFIPPILILVQYGCYYHYLHQHLAILIALFFLYIYIKIPLLTASLRLIVFLIFSALVYITAVQSYLVFVLLCVFFEFFRRKSRRTCLLCFVSALLVPYLAGKFIYGLYLDDAYRCLSFYPHEAYQIEIIFVFAFFLFFPLAGFISAFLTKKSPLRKQKAKQKQGFLDYYRKSRLIWLLETLALLALTSGIFLFKSDKMGRMHRRIDYFANYNMWRDLLDEVNQLPVQQYDLFVCHDVNRALYHTGRLLYDMFSYPQHYVALLLTAETPESQRFVMRDWLKRSATLYEVGHINEAENAATEAYVNLYYYPVCLQKLVLISLVKGRADVARTFLQLLKKDFLYKNWADKYLDKLESDTLLSNDEHIQRIRSFMLDKDNVGKTTPQDFFLKNNNNHLAFEYLIAFCLLTEQYSAVANSIKYLDNFDYPKGRIPRHLEEAILFFTARTGNVVELHGRQINVDTLKRFEDFMRFSDYYKQNTKAGTEALAKKFGDTYYYYLLYKTELMK